jgi:hypothetical protein
MAEDEEKESSVEREPGSIFAYSKLAVTPEFGEFEWWILNIFCLLTITLMATWQVTGKVAMTLNLDPPDEVWISFHLLWDLVILTPPICQQKFRKPLFLCLTHFLGLALYFPISPWRREMQQPTSAYKILGSASLGALSFLCLTSGLVYLPLSSAVLVRVQVSTN